MNNRQPRVLAILFASVFATVAGSGMALPLLPLHAHRMGAGGLLVGTLLAAYALGRVLAAWYSTRLSERVGRKPVLIAGLLAYALVSLGFALTPGAAGLVLVRLIHGAASAMLMPLFQAYIGELAPAGREGRVMGWNGSVVLTGLALGPWLGGFIADHAGLDAAFAAMGLLAVSAAILCAALLPPALRGHSTATGSLRSWREIARDREVVGLCSVRFAYVACVGMIWSFLPLYSSLSLSLSSTMIGTIIALGILTSGVLSTPMGQLADRLDRRSMIAVGGCIASAAMALLASSPDVRTLVLAIIAFGVAGGVSTPAIMAMATRRGQETRSMGGVMGLLTVAHATGLAAGGIVGGIVLNAGHMATVFAVGAMGMVAGTLMFATASTRLHAIAATEPSVGVDQIAAHR